MTSRKKQFIAGAVCPSCSDMDSLVLYTDDQSVECVSCEYTQTSGQRDQASKNADAASSQSSVNRNSNNLTSNNKSSDNKASYNKVSNIPGKNTKYKDASLINIIQIKE